VVEHSTLTVYPENDYNPKHPFQKPLAEVAKSFYVELPYILLWNTTQESSLTTTGFMQHEGRIDALSVVLLRVRQFIKILDRVCTRIGVRDDVERTMMPPGWYYHLQLFTNPLLNEGDVNFLIAASHILKKFHMHQVTDLIECILFLSLPDPGYIRVLLVLGFLNWSDQSKFSNPKDKEMLRHALSFQQNYLGCDLVTKLEAAKTFLYDHPNIVEALFNSETFFPRRPTSTDPQSFSTKFFREQMRSGKGIKKPRFNVDPASIIDVDALPEAPASTHRVAESV